MSAIRTAALATMSDGFCVAKAATNATSAGTQAPIAKAIQSRVRPSLVSATTPPSRWVTSRSAVARVTADRMVDLWNRRASRRVAAMKLSRLRQRLDCGSDDEVTGLVVCTGERVEVDAARGRECYGDEAVALIAR